MLTWLTVSEILKIAVSLVGPGQNLRISLDIRDKCIASWREFWLNLTNLFMPGRQIHLSEGLINEAEKLLCSLVCWFTDRQIRMRFIEGCLENLAHHR